MQQHQLWQQHVPRAALGTAACLPAQQALPPQQLFPAPNPTAAADARTIHSTGAAGAAGSHPTVFDGTAQQVPAPLQGLCFSMPCTSSDSNTSTDNDSSSQHGTSSSSPDSRQAGSHTPARMGTAGLLCDSPGFSPDCMEAGAPSSPAGRSTKQCTHSQHSKQQTGCGMNNHQVDVVGKPAFALPSLHSMLGGGAASKPRPAPAAPAAAGPAAPAAAPAASKLMPAHCTRFDSSTGQQLRAACAMQSSPFLSCSSQGAGDSPCASPFSTSSMPEGHRMPAAAVAASAGCADSSMVGVQGFLAACASPAAVAALAVLAYNSWLPVQPVQDAGVPDGVFGPLAATLAYMYVLGSRGGVLGAELNDTTIHTLLWLTESFFSQHRCSLRNAVYDYSFFTSGLALDDPHVLATWSTVGPVMVGLQRHILATSDFRLVVTEQQLLEAYRILDAASAAASSNPSSSSLAAIQRMVDCQVQQYQQWYDSEAERLHQLAQQQDMEHETELVPREVTPAMLFSGEQITGMLVAEQPPAPAQDSLHACRQQQKGVQNRRVLHDISNTSSMQLPTAAKPFHTAGQYSSAAKAPIKQQEQQEVPLPGRPRTRQQHKQRNQQGAGPSHAASRAASSKQVLLQLASREQAVGSKRRRDTAASEAAAATAEQRPSTRAAAAATGGPQDGVAGGFGAGGKRMLLSVMRTAQSAAQFFGCRQ